MDTFVNEDEILKLQEKMICYRRDFHKYAEAGWLEFRTTALIAEKLMSLGYEVLLGLDVVDEKSVMGRPYENIIDINLERAMKQGAQKNIIEKMNKYPGVVALLDTKRDGNTVAFRFDIDANDAVESCEDNHIPFTAGYSSVNNGMMHACGHDGHASIGPGLAELIMNNKDKFSGVIKIIFQPAEEGVRGGKAISEKGILNDVDYFFSGHIGFGLPFGTFSATTNGFLSSTKIDVEYVGKGAHAGGAPNEGSNALLAAATATINIHAIAPHSDGVTRVNVGVLNSGVGRNVIPPNATMKIETRGKNSVINEYVYERTMKIIEHCAKMYDVKYFVSKTGASITVDSDKDLEPVILNVAKNIKEITNILPTPRDIGGSEDASFMMEKVQSRGGKATYMTFGCPISAGHHNDHFDFDERVLSVALKVYYGILLQFNGANK